MLVTNCCLIGKQKSKFTDLLIEALQVVSFVDERTAQRICEVEGICPIALSRAKPVKGYNGLLGLQLRTGSIRAYRSRAMPKTFVLC